MKISILTSDSTPRWDDFLPQTAQGVFPHSRRFLSYHGERFDDLSLLIEDDRGRLRSIFPAARSPTDDMQVASHPGLTYGGLLHDASCRADEVQAMLAGVCSWYRENGLRSMLYKSVPAHVGRRLVSLDLYALWHCGAKLFRRDLWNVLDLRLPRSSSSGHQWSCKKAAKQRLTVERLGEGDYASFHQMLADGLMENHGVKPVHTLDELLDLQRRFPEEIQLWGCLTSDKQLVASTWLFQLRPGCWHTQYITANALGREYLATNLLLEELIRMATSGGVDHFSFGCSTDDEGRKLNAGLFSFKAGMGHGSVVQDFYRLEL